MSAIAMLPPDNQLTDVTERSLCAHSEPEQINLGDSQRSDDLWPWVLLPDGRLELAADAA